MSEATFEQANLQVKLYDLRREPRLREAREWFSEHFHPRLRRPGDSRRSGQKVENRYVTSPNTPKRWLEKSFSSTLKF